MKVSVIGLGYIGLPLACLIANEGIEVRGIDVIEKHIENINNGQIVVNENDLKELLLKCLKNKTLQATSKLTNSDVFVVCVPTPFKDDYSPDLSYVIKSINTILDYLRPGNLLIIESTIPTGTINLLENLILTKSKFIKNKSELNIAYCPERTFPSNVIHELIYNKRIVGGSTKKAAEKGAEFYKIFSKGEIIKTNATTAELCKLAENSFRDVNIAFANELSLICDQLKIDVNEVVRLSNMHPRVNIHQPGPGVGGHCIPVDPWFIISKFPNEAEIIKTARIVNKKKESWVLNKIIQTIKSNDIKKIFLLGLTYKADVNDFRESPALQIAKKLEDFSNEFKIQINLVDPFIHDLNIEFSKKVLLMDNLKFEKNCLFVILVNHKEFLEEINNSKDKENIYMVDFTNNYSKLSSI